MSKITIEIDMGNAIFAGEDLGPSIADCLDNLTGRIRDQTRKFLSQSDQNFRIADSNGNTVGKATMHDVEEDWGDAEDYISRIPLNYAVELLEGNFISCSNCDSVDVLRETVLQCVKDGDLTLEDVRSHCGEG